MKVVAFFIVLIVISAACSPYQSEGRECLEKGDSCVELTFSSASIKEALKFCQPTSEVRLNPPLQFQHTELISKNAFEEVTARSGYKLKSKSWQIVISGQAPQDDFRVECQFRFSSQQIMENQKVKTFMRGLSYFHALYEQDQRFNSYFSRL